MADELSLLWKLRADNTQAKTVVADTRNAVASLQRSFGPELAQTVSVANKAFADIGDNLTSLVGQRIPLVGNAFVSVTSHMRGFNEELRRGGPRTADLARQIDALSKSSGKSTGEIARFLTGFVRLESATARNDAAFKVFGGSVDLVGNKTAKFLPELEKAGTALAGVSEESAAAGAAIGGMALPIGVAVAAVIALAAGVAAAGRELFQLTKYAAEFQGQMVDLAQQTGVEVETLSALEVMARRTGGSLTTISQALVSVQRDLEKAQDPTSETAERFRKLGISTSDTETALRQAFAALAKMPAGFEQTNAAAELFGARGGKQVLAILKESGGNLDEVIRKLREAGLLITDDAARAADQFNDELALLEFQVRALSAAAAEDLIPAFVEVFGAVTDLIRAIKPLIDIFGSLAGTAVRQTASALKGLSIVVGVLTNDYRALAKAIKESRDEATLFQDINQQAIPTVQVPGVTPVPLPTTSPREAAAEAINTADAVVAASKRAAATHSQALEQMFEQGRIGRERQARELIADIQRVADAEKSRIDALLAQKEVELKALERDTDAYRKAAAEVNKLQQDQLDKEAETARQISAIRAKAQKERADSQRNEAKNSTDILLAEIDRQIKATADFNLIDLLEQAKIDAREESLKEQKRIGFLTIQEQKDLDDQIVKLGQERDQLLDEQARRRGVRQREILISNLDALLEIERVQGEARIATIQALADLRIKTEEDAAREILAIRLDLLDSEIEATKAKQEAAAGIVDPQERARTQAELANALKLLNAQRKAIQDQGNREVDEGRRQDLENERDYADELKRIKESIRDIEREAAEEVIRLMRLHFASRKDIIAAELELELDRAKQRHEAIVESIREDQRSAEARAKTLTNIVKALEAAGKGERAEYQKAVEELEKANAKKAELHAEEEAELNRSAKEKERILREARLAQKEADAVGRLTLDIDNLREFASVIESSIVPLGQILTGTFQQVADAIGQTVANWVLLGETGPAVMRKILAQALASIAAEAAVNAIKELALGFATLFFNPAESAAHFTSAGLWAAIGGVAAVAGRSVAGDLFKQKSAGGGSGGSGNNGGGPGQLSPASLARNPGQSPQQIVIKVDVKQDPHSIVDVFVDDFRNGGRTRDVTNNDGGV